MFLKSFPFCTFLENEYNIYYYYFVNYFIERAFFVGRYFQKDVFLLKGGGFRLAPVKGVRGDDPL